MRFDINDPLKPTQQPEYYFEDDPINNHIKNIRLDITFVLLKRDKLDIIFANSFGSPTTFNPNFSFKDDVTFKTNTFNIVTLLQGLKILLNVTIETNAFAGITNTSGQLSDGPLYKS